MSIKPEFAEKIFNGNKLYEYRRVVPVEKFKIVIVYSSFPDKRVIGEFEVERILSERLIALWAATKESSGISEFFFWKYFENKEVGNAIKIKNAVRYKIAKSLDDYGYKRPPQSFCYIGQKKGHSLADN